MDSDDDGMLQRLVGGVLEQVWFVADYVQLIFWVPDGPNWSLQCFEWPHVSHDGSRIAFAETGYRDALCAGIGSAVMSASEVSGRGLLIELERRSLEIAPASPELVEIAMMHPLFAEGDWMVWRPGEGVFEHLR